MENLINFAYYVTLLLVALWMSAASISIFLRKEFIHTAIMRLGYPNYFVYLLGTAKLIGVLFLLLPFPPLLKIVAFVGASIELICASVSYYVIDRKFSEWVKPLILLIVVWAAFVLWRLHNN